MPTKIDYSRAPERLQQLPVAIPESDFQSPPISRGDRVDYYKPVELKKEALNKTSRTDLFEKILVGMRLLLNRPVPFAFRESNGTVRSFDAGCLGFLANQPIPTVRLTEDERGYIVQVDPTPELIQRYAAIAQLLMARLRPPIPPATTSGRLPADLFAKITPLHLWSAVQRLIDGSAQHSFADSIDFDVLLEDGTRLAPKAVFGVAAREALGFDVLPQHFSGGMGTPCFRALEAAGYEIVRKGEGGLPNADAVLVEEWSEGGRRLVQHLRSERYRGLASAKKAQFRAENGGRLFCERCKLDPTTRYTLEASDAVIEAHHRSIAVVDMLPGHRTRLVDLECLCANCHRATHAELRRTMEAPKG